MPVSSPVVAQAISPHALASGTPACRDSSASILICARWARAERKVSSGNKIRFVRGYVQELPFADSGFDLVLSLMMWHHLDGETQGRGGE